RVKVSRCRLPILVCSDFALCAQETGKAMLYTPPVKLVKPCGGIAVGTRVAAGATAELAVRRPPTRSRPYRIAISNSANTARIAMVLVPKFVIVATTRAARGTGRGA